MGNREGRKREEQEFNDALRGDPSRQSTASNNRFYTVTRSRLTTVRRAAQRIERLGYKATLKAAWFGIFGGMRGPVALALAGSLFLGYWGGTPYQPRDFISEFGGNALKHFGRPDNFVYPGGWFLYLHGLIYGAIYVPLWLLGLVELPAADSLDKLFRLPGHLITLGFSFLGLISTYFLSMELLRNRWVGLLALVLMGTSLLWVRNSHFATVGVPFASMSIMAVWLTIRASNKGWFEHTQCWLTMGIIVGLATSILYTGALLAIPVMIASLRYFRSPGIYLRNAAVFALTALAVFLITNPYIMITPNEFREDFAFKLLHSKVGHYGYSTDNAFLFHLTTSLWYGYNPLALSAAMIGTVFLISNKAVHWTLRIAFTTYLVSLFLLYGTSSLAFQRYMIATVPLLSILSSLGVYACYIAMTRVLSKSVSFLHIPGVMAIAFFVLCLTPNLLSSSLADYVLSGRDTRKDLKAITSDVMGSGPHLQDKYYSIRVPDPTLSIEKTVLYVPGRDDVIILSSFDFDMWYYDPTLPGGNSTLLNFTSNLQDYKVIQISPFRDQKEKVPFSPESNYSPSLPDLLFRKRPGPFIEMYVRDLELAERIQTYCAKQQGVECSLTQRGYFTLPRDNPQLTLQEKLGYSIGFRLRR